MSQGALHTANMAFSNPSRSLTNLNANPLGNGSYGGPDIWSVSSRTASKDPTRESSRSRDHDLLRPTKQYEGDGRAGTRDLLRGTMSSSTAWSQVRQDPSGRTPPTTRNGDQQQYAQPWHLNTSGLQSFQGVDNVSPVSTRPPAVNITNQGFNGSQSYRSPPGYTSPPTVYTKRNQPPIAIDTPRVSPTDQRKGPWTVTASSSREPSQPPSRHSNFEPPWADANSRTSYNSARNQSVSSQRNPSYGSQQSAYDQPLPQFGQLSMNQNGHPGAGRRPSEFTNGSTSQKTMSNLSFPSSMHQGRFELDPTDDIEEIGRTQMSYLELDGYAPNQTSNSFGFHKQNRPSQTSTPFEFRPGQAFVTGSTPPRDYSQDNGSRATNDWSLYGSNALAKQSSGLPNQQALLDPRIQQMMTLGSSYEDALFNPYAMPLSATSPYYPMFPIGLPGLDSGMPLRDPLMSDGVQSLKLYEFKNVGKNNKRYELKDIFDHIAEFAGDQHGSRFIQTKLETANSDEKDRVFREIEPNAIPLMTDVFGNYVIQKFFDHGHQDHKRMLANKMRGQVLSLSLQMYGCRVVQKALEHVLVEQQAALIAELENHVLQCVKDQNGNHVIQKAIERCPSETIAFIYRAFLGQVQHLSLHPYGCRVIQRCLERQDNFPGRVSILSELHDGMQHGMIADQYGNYVVQHVIEKGGPLDKQHVFAIVIQGIEGYSKHKFASNVVEKCIEHSDNGWKREVINVLVMNDQRMQEEQRRGGLMGERESVLVGLIKDNFGNYVIQKLLDKLSMQDYVFFHQHLQPAISHAKRTGGGKQLIAIEKKMHRVPMYPHGHGHPFPLALPPTPYASNYGSVANTPPPLTSDTRSLQSSGIPSVNGDTVEGATSMSRKGSEPSTDGTLLR